MKEAYLKPEMEIEIFDVEDIITGSQDPVETPTMPV